MKRQIQFMSMIIFLLIFNGIKAQSIDFQKPALIAKYDSSATVWESEALPIGNGYMGAMIYGGVYSDIIQVNEHTLWSGGPGANPNYNGGHLRTPEINKRNLQDVRNALQVKMTDFSKNKAAFIDANGRVVTNNYTEDKEFRMLLLGRENEDTGNPGKTDPNKGITGSDANFGSYQTLGNIEIAYNSVAGYIINIETDCESTQSAEAVANLFDNNINTKWYAAGGFKSLPCYIAWEYPAPYTTKSYSLTSGNDTPGRDPKSWKLYGSNNGSSYTLINEQTNIVFDQRRQTKTFNLAKAETYKYYKIEITAIQEDMPPQLSEISLIPNADLPEYTNYSRQLDIDNSIHTISYNEDGTLFSREYFMSYPDNILVIRLKANASGKISRTFSITSPQPNKTITAQGNVITMTGRPTDHRTDALKFAQQVKIINTGGSLSTVEGRIVVENADEVVLLMAAATNYLQSKDNNFNYFSSIDPLTTVQQTMTKASSKTYDQLLLNHQTDYKALYERMGVNLGNIGSAPAKTTDKLLSDYYKTNTAAENLYTEMLFYQFGRYLLISSSRKNSLPANLQGVWAQELHNPWSADYHTNINIQMNYWLTQPTNLSECHYPMFDYINSLVPRGTYTAQHYYCKPDGSPNVRGWVIGHASNVWAHTAPSDYYWGFNFPTAAGWLCQDIWEYYQFNLDKTFLAEHYNTMLQAALFWVDNLWRDERDGSLVANPSYSPEHGEYSLGASCDQAIIWELFDMVLKASEALGKNTLEVAEIKDAKSKLAGPQIGLGGQFMEWKDETTRDITGDGGHRHVNHLHWLHPGSQIVSGRSAQENLYVEAMKKTLYTRGDEGTGWSKAWKLNFWARLRDGNHAHTLLKSALTLTYADNPANIGGVYQNLFDTHPPFQIDGNFGATAGMTEMLLQSQGDCIELLPALPDVWATGTFKGIKARGNFEVSTKWDSSNITAVEIKSISGNDCVIKYKNIKNYTIKLKGGSTITPTVIDDDKISFKTTAGRIYDITM